MALQMQTLAEADFASVIEIQTAWALNQDDAARGATGDGFLISAYREEDLKRFLASGGRIWGARNGTELVGYLIVNSGVTFLRNHPHTALDFRDGALRAAYEERYRQGRFAYLDQIGVRRSYQGTSVARRLHDVMRETLRPSLVLAAIVCEPARNTRSLAFFAKMGYRHIGDFFTPQLRGFANVCSAVMALDSREDAP